MKEFIQTYFDKLLLSLIFIGLVVLTVHLIHDAERAAAAAGVQMTSTDFVNWAETQAGTVLGALLTLITGIAGKALIKSESEPKKDS